jgi:hypothetical protein
MSEMIKHLKEIEHNLDKETYRSVVAEVSVKHFIKRMRDQKMKINRQLIVDRTNFVLRSMGIEEISYGFVRQYC